MMCVKAVTKIKEKTSETGAKAVRSGIRPLLPTLVAIIKPAEKSLKPDRLEGRGSGTEKPGSILKPGEKLTEDVTKFQPNKLGTYFAQSPEGRLLSGGAGFAGTVGKKALGAGKYLASSPLTLASAGLYGGKKLYDELVTAEKEGKSRKEMTNIIKDFKPDSSYIKQLEDELVNQMKAA